MKNGNDPPLTHQLASAFFHDFNSDFNNDDPLTAEQWEHVRKLFDYLRYRSGIVVVS